MASTARAGPAPADAAGAGGDHQAGGEPVEVPFERARERLVEVPEIEGQVPLRSGPQSEVEDVSIAAELDLDAAVGPRREVRGHDGRRTAEVVPRGQGHPTVAQGEELRIADVLLVEEGGE